MATHSLFIRGLVHLLTTAEGLYSTGGATASNGGKNLCCAKTRTAGWERGESIHEARPFLVRGTFTATFAKAQVNFDGKN